MNTSVAGQGVSGNVTFLLGSQKKKNQERVKVIDCNRQSSAAVLNEW